MKLKIQVCVTLLLLLLPLSGTFGDDRTVSYESYVFESFDDNPLESWVIRGSKNIEEGYPEVAEVNIWPQALWGKNPDTTELYCIGVHAKFTARGYNYLEIVPATEAPADAEELDIIHVDESGKKWVHNPIPFRGRARSFDVWVWGSNYDYYMEVYLEDHNSTIYRLPLGSLAFVGWKNLSTDIPLSIPQSEKYIPSLRRLKLVKLMVWTRPSERVDDFYIYIDQIKILTDLFESRFDGDELQDPQLLQDIWGTDE